MAPKNMPIFIYRLVIFNGIFNTEMTDQLSFCVIMQSSDFLFPNLLQCLRFCKLSICPTLQVLVEGHAYMKCRSLNLVEISHS